VGRPAPERADPDPARSRRGEGSLSPPPRLLARLARALAPGGALVAVLDYDGTLTPIVGAPRAARLAPRVRATLAALAVHPRVGLAILSGRALGDVRRRVGVSRVVYGGCHGLEIAGAGLAFRHPAARRARVAAARRLLRAAVRGLPGVRLESKGLAVSLHYRHVAAARLERPAGDPERTRRWLPVDFYIGGNEHAVLHLMYTRFLCLAFHDLGLIEFDGSKENNILLKENWILNIMEGNCLF